MSQDDPRDDGANAAVDRLLANPLHIVRCDTANSVLELKVVGTFARSIEAAASSAQRMAHVRGSEGVFRASVLLALAIGAVAYPVRSRAMLPQDRTAIVVAVVTDTAGRFLSGVDVQIVATSLRGNTDDFGRVALLAVPVGRAVLKLRRLGFTELTIPILVTPGLAPAARYILRPSSTNLDTVVVRASGLKPERYANTGRFDAFYRRRAQGLGTFFTRENIDQRNAQKSEDLLRMVSGVRIRYRGNMPSLQFLRCETVNVYIDGVRSLDPFRDFVAMSPLQIEAMEVYHGMATVPPEFSPRPNDCAAIVVWTRWHGAG